MVDAVEIGKVSVRIMPDTDGFRREAEALLEAIEQGLKINVGVEISVPDAVAEAETAAAAAQETLDRRPLKMRVNLDDQDDVKRGIAKLEDKLVDLGRTTIEVDMDEDSILRELSNLKGVLDDIATIDVKFDPDSIRSLDRGIAQIDREMEKLREETMQVHLDENSLQFAKERLEHLRDEQVKLEVEVDNKAFAKLREVVEHRLRKLNVDFDLDEDGQQLKKKIDKLITQQRELQMQIVPELSARDKHDLERQIDDIDGQISVSLAQLSKRRTQAELAILARRREATISPKVDQAAAARVASTLAALSGGRALSDIGTDVADWLGNLDKAVPRIVGASLAIGNLSSAVLTSTSNLFSLGASIATVGQAGLALPGIFGGMAIGLGATFAVLKDFNKRIPEVKERLADLQDQMSDKFWAKAEAPIRNLANTLFPLLETSLGNTSANLGDFFANLANSAEGKFGTSLSSMFDGLNQSIQIASQYTDNFVGIIDKLGQLGAQNLPELARWFGEISQDFDNFLGEKGTAGLQEFVDRGVDALQDLGAATRDTFGTIAAIAEVAEQSGASTLGTLRETMASVRETVESPSFQLALRDAFTGAREGLEAFSDAAGSDFKKLIETLTGTMADVLPSLGAAGGDLLGGIFGALARPAIQKSIVGFFESVEKAIAGFTPSLPGVSDALAGVVDVIATLAEGIGDTLGDALDVAGPALENLADHAKPLAEQLTALIDNLVAFAGPAVADLASGLGTVADVLTTILTPLNELLDLLEKIPGSTELIGGVVALGAIVGAVTWLGAGVRSKILAVGKAMTEMGEKGLLAGSRMEAAGAKVSGFADKITAKRAVMAGVGTAAVVVADQVGLTNTALGAMMGSFLPGVGTAVGAAVGGLIDLAQATGNTRKELEELRQVTIDLANGGDLSGLNKQLEVLEAKESSLLKKRDGLEDVFGGQLWQDTFNSLLGNERAFETVGKQIDLTKLEAEELNTVMNKLGAGLGLIDQGDVLPKDLQPEVLNAIAPALADMGISIRDLATNSGDLGTLLSDTATNFGGAVTNLTDQVLLWVQMQDEMVTRTDNVRNAFAGLDSQTKTNTQSANELRTAMDNLMNPAVGLIQTTDQWHAGLANLSSSLSPVSTALRGQTEAARQNRAVIIEQANNLADLAVEQVNAGRSSEQVQRSFIRQRDALIQAATQAGLNKDAVKALLKEIGLTPKLVTTEFREKGGDKVKNKAKEIKDAATSSATALEHKLGFDAPAVNMQQYIDSITGSVDKAKAVAASGGLDVGTNLKNGVIQGFSGTQAILSAQAYNAVIAAVRAATKAGDIHSPSRKMDFVGRMLGEGLAGGLESTSARIAGVATRITQKMIDGYEDIGETIDKTLSKIDSKAKKKYKSAHKDDIKQLKQLSTAYENAWQKLKDLLDEQKSFRESISNLIIESGNPANFDILTPNGIITGLQDAVAQAKKFQAIVQQLAAQGLNSQTLRQIVEAGPETGLAVAQSVMDAGIQQINDLQAQLSASAAATAETAGTGIFGGLIAQAQGNVDALIEKLQPLSKRLRKFAKDLVAALRDQLEKEFSSALVTTTAAATGATPKTPKSGGGKGKKTVSVLGVTPMTLNYYAAPGPQLTAEEQLFGAAGRARMVL